MANSVRNANQVKTMRYRAVLHMFCVLVLCVSALPVFADSPGENIKTVQGFLNCIGGDGGAKAFVLLEPPELGRQYEIKVNFLGAESFASVIDSYFDSLNEAAQSRGEDGGSATWNLIRHQLKDIDSSAEFVVRNKGRVVDRVSGLWELTFGKTFKFVADSAEYRVEVKCTEGAGLYRLTFEWD